MIRKGKQAYPTPEQLLERYDELGIERAVVMTGVNPECVLQPQSNEESIEIYKRWPERFIPFCNVDPRAINNSFNAPLGELIGYYKEQGCKGVGEVTINLPFNHPMVENLFKYCQELQMPLTFHVATTIGGTYGLYDKPGLPLLEGALRKFPGLIFLAHSQPFWAEIGSLDTIGSRDGYPSGPVKEEGAVPKLMRKYPNLHGDLSAGSGYNAINRDLEFGCRFLEEFQDRLYFGTDICAPDTNTPLVGLLKNLVATDKISKECFKKISRGNAKKLFGIK